MTIRMGYWDCPTCGAKKNLGPNPTCGGCGRPRGPNIAFYTDDSAPVVEDPELVARARAGADWKCKYCSAENRAGVLDCHQCGAGPDGSVKRQERVLPDASPVPPQPARSGKTALLVIGGVIATIAALVWFFFIRTTELMMTVESVAWRKTAVIEREETKRLEAWQDEVPTDASIVSRTTKSRSKQVQDGTKKVKTGKKDLGNGMFEDLYKEEPNLVTKQVDDTWVTYEVKRWVDKEKLESKSTDGSEPPAPEKGRSIGRNERVGKRESEAVFKLEGSDGKSYTYEIDVDEAGPKAIGKFKVDKRYKAKVNGAGAVVSMGP